MASFPDRTFGDLVRRYRLDAGMTQAELAEKAGLSERGISDLERGLRARPQRETLLLLAEALALGPDGRATLEAAIRRPILTDRAAPHEPDTAPSAPSRRATGFPLPLTGFVGREPELSEIKKLLGASRLVMLTGPSGCGKTRLAVQVATSVADDFVDAVVFVSLADLTDPGLVAPAIAQALGVDLGANESVRETLLRHLRDQDLLLVLDNCEALAGPAVIVADLLAGCPRLRVLATSQFVLRLSGEQEFRVPGLRRPDPGPPPPLDQLAEYDAIRLFVARARATRAEFALTPDNAADVAQICQLLDGIPLAIELAAARVRVLPPKALLARLTTAPGGLEVLAGGPEDRPVRQQTLRQAIAWSYGLLEPAEQALLRRLSVFASGWTLEAAEAICGDAGGEGADKVLRVLTSLVDKSLVVVEEQAGGTSRFGLLGTVREYVLERAREHGDAEDLAWRHRAYFFAVAADLEPRLHGPEREAALRGLDAEQANLRAAVEGAAADDRGGAGSAAALLWFWQFRGSSLDQPDWMDEA